MTLIDFSSQPPAGFFATARALGYGGGLVYVSAYPSKNLSTASRSEAAAAGFALALVYEDGAADFTGGANVGAAKAHIAAPILKDLAWPADRPVYASVDLGGTGMAPSLYQQTWEGISTFANLLGRPPAAYGIRPFLYWLEHMHGVRYLWECGSASTNTGPEPTGYIQQQGSGIVDGISCDFDQLVNLTDWGQVPSPVQPQEESDMTLYICTDAPKDHSQAQLVGGCARIGLDPVQTAEWEKILGPSGVRTGTFWGAVSAIPYAITSPAPTSFTVALTGTAKA